ncbi:MAG TPA: DUF4013 domain-containing protein [Candidatus Dormibacteraeota bacterium]|jgi:hypothetical protein
MNSLGDAFGYAFKDPKWVEKILVQGLILIIPIVGWIAAAGWLMITFDNLRSGRLELAPAGFHLRQGIGLFGVVLIYSVVVAIPGGVLAGIGSAAVGQSRAAAASASSLGSLINFAGQLLIDFLLPSLIVMTHHYGFAGGMDVPRVWALATRNVGNSVIGGLILLAAGIIGWVGVFACCIGLFFTAIYGLSISAGAAAWFERQQSAPSLPAT